MPISRYRPFFQAALIAMIVLPRPAFADADAGAYLAARIAGMNDDYPAAANWFTRALISDPADPALMEGAMTGQLGAGNMEAAIAIAARLHELGIKSQTATLALIADRAKRDDYAGLIADLEAGSSVGALLDDLVRAWAELGTGQMSDALAELDKLASTKGLEAFGLYHKALALATVGDFEGAEAILSGRANGPIQVMRRGVLAHAQILSQLERNPEAITVLSTAFQLENDPAAQALVNRLEAGETLDYTVTRNATDGLAEVFFTMAAALNGEATDGYTLLYARVATWLRPDHSDAILMTATLLEAQGQYDLAVETYARIPATDGGFFAAEIGRARALRSADKKDASLEVLTALSRSHAGLSSVQIALGDALRRDERWADAVAAYDAAVALIKEPGPQHWSLFYSRAISHERSKNWDLAEPDFRRALELQPDQPQVLNYLGYSYLERNENLAEAMAMIERAVAAQPDSGYITDSLAWGLFRLGRYAEAVEPMERASLLEPVDPVVTDHLGDVYWAVGRQLEANFQWRRALSFAPEEKEATRIRRKLEIGLDAVLAEEGAKSLADVANGN